MFKKKNKAALGEKYADADNNDMLHEAQDFVHEKLSIDDEFKEDLSAANKKKRNSAFNINTGIQQLSDSKDKVSPTQKNESSEKKEHPFSVPKAASSIHNPFDFRPAQPEADDFDLLGSTGHGQMQQLGPHDGMPDLMIFDKFLYTPASLTSSLGSSQVVVREQSPDRKQIVSKKVASNHKAR